MGLYSNPAIPDSSVSTSCMAFILAFFVFNALSDAFCYGRPIIWLADMACRYGLYIWLTDVDWRYCYNTTSPYALSVVVVAICYSHSHNIIHYDVVESNTSNLTLARSLGQKL